MNQPVHREAPALLPPEQEIPLEHPDRFEELLPRLPGAHTSFAVLIQPVLTIVWGIFILDETPSFQQSLGMVMILGAIIAVTLYGSATTESES